MASTGACPMTDVHRVILRKGRVCLVENLDMQIIDFLVAAMIVNAEDEERINALPVRRDKVKHLVDLLPRRGDSAYQRFMEILREKQHFLYLEMKKLEQEEEIAAANNTQYASGLFDIPCGSSGDASNMGALGSEHLQTRGIVTQATDCKIKIEDIKPSFPQPEPMGTQTPAAPQYFHEITGPDTGQLIHPKLTTPFHPNKEVTQQCLSKLAGNLGSEWEQLAVSMGFKSNKLYHWKEDNRNNVWGQVFAFLIGWKNSKGSNATIGNLINAINKFEGIGIEAYRHLFFE